MESTLETIVSSFDDSVSIKNKIRQDAGMVRLIGNAAEIVCKAYENKHKLLIAGNGGSAADAQHIAGELVSTFGFERPALPAMALTTDSSIITAIGNDYAYETIFSRQIEANGNSGDVLLAISTSGNSKNIIEAAKVARTKEIVVIGLTGESGGQLGGLSDICIRVPSNSTPRIQESHILISHILCDILEKHMFGTK